MQPHDKGRLIRLYRQKLSPVAEAGHARSALSRLGVSPSASASASSTASSGSSSGSSSDSGQLLGRYQGKRLVPPDAEYKKEFDAMPKREPGCLPTIRR
ncbi:MAG: hypothetical protein R3F51_19150 [Cyanobacteriota/Melainabacteria group bacterium]